MLDTFDERGEQRDFSHPVFEQLRARNQVFSGMFAAMDGHAGWMSPASLQVWVKLRCSLFPANILTCSE
jgi:hypothetical protein